MNPHDILEVIKTGAQYSFIGFGAGLTCLSAYTILLQTHLLFSNRVFHKEIKTKEELDRIIETEAKKLGLNSALI